MTKNPMVRRLLGTIALASIVAASYAAAQVPRLLNYQGYLTNASGQPVNATVTMGFRLYTVAVAGMALYTETQSIVVSNGVYNAQIGASTPLSLPFDVPYYLGVTVDADPEMTPRQAVAASPYALRAAGVDATAALPAGQIIGTIGTTQIANAAVTAAKLSTNGCSPNQVLKVSGSTWICANDVDTVGVTSITAGAGLTGGTITGSGTIALDPGSATLTGNYFRQGGNAFGILAGNTAVLATNDNNAVDFRVNGARALRLEPTTATPNVIGGYSFNSVGAGVAGAAIAGGGQSPLGYNSAGGNYGAIGGGAGNVVNGDYGAIPGGFFNSIFNTAAYATILGGTNNQAHGYYSIAGGRNARAGWAGQTVIADATDLLFDPPAQGNWGGNGTNTFNVRATAGVLFVTAIDALGNTVKRTWFDSDGHAYTTGSFVNGSDRAAKERFKKVAGRRVLERVSALPVTEWSYKGQTQRHIGPMAQDFRAAFGLGNDDKTISTVDAAGVALAAIQGLHQVVQEKEREIAGLKAKAAEVDLLQRKLAAIEAKLGIR